MRQTATRRAMVAALLWFGCGWMASAHAGTALTTPAGLTPGEQFRFVFVTTDPIQATSSDISTYDSFVQSQADGATYNGVTVTWQAIGSTATVNAIDHIGQTDTPVYLVDGTEVATSTTTSGLWSGSPLINPIDEDIAGNVKGVFVWTGTNIDGQAVFPLGGPENVIIGDSSTVSQSWVQDDVDPPSSDNFIYGISGVETVLQAVPEPTSMLLLGTGGVMVGAYGWTRRRRDRRQGPVVGPIDKLR